MEIETMKPILFSALFALIAACAGSETKGDTAKTTNVGDLDAEKVDGDGTPDASACTEESALECEEGFVDACLLTPASATTHACVEGELPAEVPVTTDAEPSSDEPAANE